MATYDAIRTQISQGKTQGVDYLVDYGDATRFYLGVPSDFRGESGRVLRTEYDAFKEYLKEQFADEISLWGNEIGNVTPDTDVGSQKQNLRLKTKNLIPGVDLNSYWMYNQDSASSGDNWDDDGLFQQGFKFSKPEGSCIDGVVVNMPEQYNLSRAYKGGFEKGDGITSLQLSNLNNTAISGTLYKKDDVKNFYDTFIKDKNASKLPQSLDLALEVGGILLYDGELNSAGYKLSNDIPNLAGSNIDKIIGTWYDKKGNSGFNFSTGNTNSWIFDAKDLCSEDMYNAQTGHFNDAYPVDINAALVIGANSADGVKNVLVNGDLKIDNGTVKGDNIRFAVDSMNGKSYKYQRSTAGNPGIVDFSNANVPNEVKFGLDTGSKVIFDSLNSDVYLSKIGSAQVGEFILKHLEGESHLKRGNEGAIQVVNYTNLTNLGDDKAVYGATTGNSWSNYFYWKRGTGVELDADDHRINNGNDHSAALISKVMPKESKKDLNPKQMNVLLGGKEYC